MATSIELKTKAAELRKIADKLDEAAKALASLDSGNGTFPVPIATPQQTKPLELGDLAKMSGVDAIQCVMVDNGGHPLSKPDILKRLKARGKAIGENTLGAYLSREPRFKSYGEGKWGLVDKVYSQ
jgi:hypothetical protein